MTIREKLAWKLLIKHVTYFKWIPHKDDPNIGDGYFKLPIKWYNIIRFIGGKRPEELVNVYDLRNRAIDGDGSPAEESEA